MAYRGILVSVAAPDLDGWVAEPKLYGWRARVLVDPELPGGVSVQTRRGPAVTAPVPRVADLAASGLRVVLDGELVAHASRAHYFYSLGPTSPAPDATQAR